MPKNSSPKTFLKVKNKITIKINSKLSQKSKLYYYDYKTSSNVIHMANRKKTTFFLSGLSKQKIKAYNDSVDKSNNLLSQHSTIKIEKDWAIKTNNYFDSFMLFNFIKKDKHPLLKVRSLQDIGSSSVFKRTLFCGLLSVFRKQKFLSEFKFKKQFIYRVISVIFSLKENLNILISSEVSNHYFSKLCLKKELNFIQITDKLRFFTLFNYNWEKTDKLISKKHILCTKDSYIQNLFYLLIYLRSIGNDDNLIFDVPNKLYISSSRKTYIEKIILSDVRSLNLDITYNNLYNYSELRNVLTKSTANILKLKSNFYFLNNLKHQLTKKNENIFNFIWKKSFIDKRWFFFSNKKRSFGRAQEFNAFSKNLSKSLLFVLSKIYIKMKQVSKNGVGHEHLLFLKNMLFFEIFNKISKQKSKNLVLSNRMFMKDLRKKKWFFFFLKQLSSEFKSQNTALHITPTFPQKQGQIRRAGGFIGKPKAYKNAINLNYSKTLNHKQMWSRRRKNVRKKFLWKEKKLVLSGLTPKFNQLNTFFSFLFKNTTALFFINALSLAKFAFIYPIKKKSVNKFLSQVERQMIGRYKYVAVYIQDLVRISFLSLFLKKPAFLTSFIGFQISKLPKNRKETKLVKFIIKVVKIFSSQRIEMIGLKIEFKGRVNRWRRTKIIRGIGGSKILLPLYSYDTQIEFGSSKSITRKGALGIRLWLCYKYFFGCILSEVILGYVKYAQNLKLKAVKRFLNKFKTKTKLC